MYVPMLQLANELKKAGVDTSKIDLEKAIIYYEESRKLELERLSNMQNK
jgi:hypothetical protein